MAPIHSLSSTIIPSARVEYLFVYAVFLGEINHSLDVFRFCLVEERPVTHDITAAFTCSVDKVLYIVFYLLGRAQFQQVGGHVTGETGNGAKCFLSLSHVALV